MPNQAIAIQIDLLRRAEQEERRRERSEADRTASLRGKAETDEPAGRPSGPSLPMTPYRLRSTVRNADRYQKAADDLAALRLRAGGQYAEVIRMGGAADAWLVMDGPADEFLPSELRMAKITARVEHMARAGYRSIFPTVAGPRTSVIEATAIWSAEECLKSAHSGLSLIGYRAEAKRPLPQEPFYWVVDFVSPKTGTSYRVKTSLGEGSITDYLTKHP